jgi:hypothetical protein
VGPAAAPHLTPPRTDREHVNLRYRYVHEPHPHLVIEEIVAPELYAALRFPDALVAPNAEWGITSSDAAYAEVLADRGWSALHDELRAEPFVRSVLAAFAADMRAEGCLTDPQQARVVAYEEGREDKQKPVLARRGDPQEIYTRLDFQCKGTGAYREFVHLDWARRIVGGILFFSDADEEGIEGGELALYRDRDFRNDRWCHDPQLVAKFSARHNTGVIFLNSNRGFHGPRAITRQTGYRRWLYFTISSMVDVWPCAQRAA